MRVTVPADTRRLGQLTLEILGADTNSRLRPEVLAIAELLGEHATPRSSADADIADGETWLDDGLALSPTMAAMCAEDFQRTATFLRGVHRAICDTRVQCPERPVRVLYAGCGPYGLLATPLMAVLAPEQVRFTLLDLHAASVDSARRVVEALGMSAFVEAFVVADACRYELAADWPPDIIVSETMNACLEKEPQVAIWRNLSAQAPHATLIPEAVRVDALLVDVGKEFSFAAPGSGAAPAAPRRDRIFLGTVFELTREVVAGWPRDATERLPAGTIELPSPRPSRHDPMLFTRIRVYADEELGDYASGLTVPRPLPYAGSLAGGERLTFHYRLGNHPALICGDEGC